MKILFFLLCICTLALIVIKLYKINEKFVSDFDEVMDNKCMIVTNNQKDNYVFNRGVCEKNTCPQERCSYLRLDTMTGYNHYMSEIAPKYSSNDVDGNFVCVTKESLPDKIYCETMPPVCEYLGAEDYCIDYVDNAWDRQEYRKVLTSSGNCVWKNKFTNDEYMDGSFLAECRKEPLNCSLCNLPCSTGFNKYQTFSVNSNSDKGIFCEQDPDVCGEGCDPLSKTGYKLNSTDRQYEPILFRQQMMRNSACVYVYVDQYGDEYCHPDHSGQVFTKYECQFHDDIISELNTEIKDCYTNDYKWCCNLDDRDMFEKTKYEPVISRDGENCVYRTVDRSLSIELEMDTVTGFNCPGYEFRLCQNQDEFRNVFEQKCTSCPIGKYIRDNTQMTAYYACAPIPDCSSNIDSCFENINESGTIQKEVGYQQIPQIQYSADGGLNTATCVSTTPSDCIRDCNKPPLTVRTQGNFCDLCSTTDNPDLEINPDTIQCEAKIPCESETTVCLDRRYNTFYDYTLGQDDEFSPCVYKKVGNETDTLQPLECSQECPPNYVKNNEPNNLIAGDKCEIPKCIFSRTVTINNPLIVPSFVDLDNETKNTVFEQIDTNDAYKYHEDYCKIGIIERTVQLNSYDNATVCKITSDSEILPEAAYLVDQNQLYSIPFTLNVQPHQKQGTNDCPSDCTYADPGFKDRTDGKCIDRVNGRTAYGPGEDTQGTHIKTSMKTKDHNRFGTTCPQAKSELLGGISETSYVLNDKGDRLEFSYLCPLPIRDIDCESREICTNCEDRGTCDFKKTCHVVIDTHPFGVGTECPSTVPTEQNCPQTCPNCMDVSEWSIDDYDWENIQPSPTQDRIYTRSLVTTQNCLYASSGTLNPEGPNQTIDTQTLSVSRPALSETEITNACGDNLYTWTPTVEQVCSCTDGSFVQFSQEGTLISSSPVPVVRGLTVTCPSSESRDTNCSDYYDSYPCQQQRDNLDISVRSAENAANTAVENLNTDIGNLEIAITNGNNNNIETYIITNATNVKNDALSLQTRTQDSADAIDDLFKTYPPPSSGDKEAAKTTADNNVRAINSMIATINAQISNINTANNTLIEEICNDATNYGYDLSSCSQTLCDDNPSSVTGILKAEYRVISCPSSIPPPTELCPCTLLADGYYILNILGDKYLSDSLIGDTVDNATIFELSNVSIISANASLIKLKNIVTNQYLTNENQPWNFSFTDGVNDSTFKIIKTNSNAFNIYMQENGNDDEYTRKMVKEVFINHRSRSNNSAGFRFEPVNNTLIEEICNDATNYDYDLSSCSQTLCDDNPSSVTGILKYRVISCPSSIPPPTELCPCRLLADGYYKIWMEYSSTYIGPNANNTINEAYIYQLESNELISETEMFVSLKNVNTNKYWSSNGNISIEQTSFNNIMSKIRIRTYQSTISWVLSEKYEFSFLIDMYENSTGRYNLRIQTGCKFEPVDTTNICDNEANFNFATCPVQTHCGGNPSTITGALKNEYSSVATCPSPPTQTCPSIYDCIEISGVNKGVNGFIVTINSITIANSESMTNYDLNNLYLQVALMKDDSWISDFFINSELTIDNEHGHHIIELNSNDWDITDGTIQHNTSGAFNITVSEPGEYNLYMGFTRKYSNTEYMHRDGGWGYRGIVEDTSYPFNIVAKEVIAKMKLNPGQVCGETSLLNDNECKMYANLKDMVFSTHNNTAVQSGCHRHDNGENTVWFNIHTDHTVAANDYRSICKVTDNNDCDVEACNSYIYEYSSKYWAIDTNFVASCSDCPHRMLNGSVMGGDDIPTNNAASTHKRGFIYDYLNFGDKIHYIESSTPSSTTVQYNDSL